MHRALLTPRLVAVALTVAGSLSIAPAPIVDPALYAGLSWRNVGPFRGGRVAAVSGTVGQLVFVLGGAGGTGYESLGCWIGD